MKTKRISLLIVLFLYVGGLFLMPPALGVTTQTEIVQIANTYDDLYRIGGGEFVTTSNIVVFYNPDLSAVAYLRFLDVDVPRDSVITSAVLSVYRGTAEPSGTGVESTVMGIALDDCPAFAGPWAGPYQTEYPTTSAVVWHTDTFGVGWHNVSVGMPVSEITRRLNWQNGSAIGFIIQSLPVEEITRAFWDYSYSPALSAKLYITFTTFETAPDVGDPGFYDPDPGFEAVFNSTFTYNNQTVFIWEIVAETGEETISTGSNLLFSNHNSQSRILTSNYTERVYAFAANATGTYIKSRPVDGGAGDWGSWALFLNGVQAYIAFDVDISPDGRTGWYVRLTAARLYARKFSLSGSSWSWEGDEQDLGTTPDSYPYESTPVMHITSGGYPFIGVVGRSGEVRRIYCLYSESTSATWDNAANSPQIMVTTSATYTMTPILEIVSDSNHLVRVLFGTLVAGSNIQWGERNIDADAINGGWTTGSTVNIATQGQSYPIYMGASVSGSTTYQVISYNSAGQTWIKLYSLTGTAPTRSDLDSKRFFNVTTNAAMDVFANVYADANGDLLTMVSPELTSYWCNYWRAKVGATYYPTGAWNFQNFTATGLTMASRQHTYLNENYGRDYTFAYWYESAPVARLVVRRLATGVNDPLDFTVGDSTYTVVFENGTVAWTGPTPPDNSTLIDILGPDPDDPNPPGWDATGVFTYNNFRLYVLIFGLVLLLGPLIYLATRPEGLASYIYSPVVMLLGAAILYWLTLI